VCSSDLLIILGIILYVFNIHTFDFALFIVSVVMIFSGVIGVMTVDQKMKVISKKIKEL
jgi:membrane-bound ClpP family serine protease